MGKAILLSNIEEVSLKVIILIKIKTQESFIIIKEQSNNEKDLFFNPTKNYPLLLIFFLLYSGEFTYIPRFIKNGENKKKKTAEQRFNKEILIVSKLLTGQKSQLILL